jgi:hypothetical protein
MYGLIEARVGDVLAVGVFVIARLTRIHKGPIPFSAEVRP